jgi:hypothetical protein
VLLAGNGIFVARHLEKQRAKAPVAPALKKPPALNAASVLGKVQAVGKLNHSGSTVFASIRERKSP